MLYSTLMGMDSPELRLGGYSGVSSTQAIKTTSSQMMMMLMMMLMMVPT